VKRRGWKSGTGKCFKGKQAQPKGPGKPGILSTLDEKKRVDRVRLRPPRNAGNSDKWFVGESGENLALGNGGKGGCIRGQAPFRHGKEGSANASRGN